MSDSRTPFVIWTLQRTGGTNLTTRLVELAGLKSAPHEPFNLGRIYGHITQAWQESGNAQALQQSIKSIVAKGEIIKHCVETIPWKVTEHLAKEAQAAGYRHLFLYRRNATDRLLSLHFARETGIWGPDMKAMKAMTGAPEIGKKTSKPMVCSPLPVERLITHERRSMELLQMTLDLLQKQGAKPTALAYEDVYRAKSLDAAQSILARVLTALGISIEESVLPDWTSETIGKGDQGTREKYRDIPGYAELAKRTAQLPGFMEPSRKPVWRQLGTNHSWITRIFVDVLPETVSSGKSFEIGGVVVLGREAPDGGWLEMRVGDEILPVTWDIKSDRIAKEYPQAKNRDKARWSAKCCFDLDRNFAVVQFVVPDRPPFPLFEILIEPFSDTKYANATENRLIIDVGANDGADTAYYLSKGFRVVAVEAIPDLAHSLEERFSSAINDNRLHVVQAAIHQTPGEIEFLVNPGWTEWSSAHNACKARTATTQTLRVPAVRLADLIEHFGHPWYVKIDIEGGEFDAIESLFGLAETQLPPYISFETNSQVFEVIQSLWNLGYREFQLVRQGASYLPIPFFPCKEGVEHRIPFTSNMSGPFGRDLPDGNWVGIVGIVRHILKSQEEMKERTKRGENPGWFDIHARRSLSQECGAS